MMEKCDRQKYQLRFSVLKEQNPLHLRTPGLGESPVFLVWASHKLCAFLNLHKFNFHMILPYSSSSLVYISQASTSGGQWCFEVKRGHKNLAPKECLT